MTSPYPNPSTSSSSHRSTVASTQSHNSGKATTSNSGPASALRPRNRRLVSTELSPGPGTKGGTSGNRDASPIPSRHPSRIVGAKGIADGRRPMGGLVDLTQDGAGATSPIVGFGKGIWEGGWTGSWSALQGLASSVLGGDVGEEGEREDSVRKRPRASSGQKVPMSWGPSGLQKEADSIGAGSLAARDLAVKALKTASVLESHEGLNGLDLNGNYKRRTSVERPSSRRNDEEDSLVYVHHVTPQDTQAGIVLKYNCQPAVFRKANRFLPTDVPQMRKVVFLPVDACAAKGKPWGPPSEGGLIDLLAPTPGMEDSPSLNTPDSNGGAWSSSPYETPGKDNRTEQDGRSWNHIRWVLLDSSPSVKPVEIARLPRKSLGYFPPRRRKSQCTFSPASTPRSSFQISEEPNTGGSGSGTPPRGANDLGHLSAKNSGGYFPPPVMNPNLTSHNRRDSSTHSNAAHAPPKWLTGPGGVGSLSKEVRAPGPAEDGFNAWAQKHMPILSTKDLPSSSATGGAETKLLFGFQKEVDSIAESQTLRPFPTVAESGTVTPSDSRVNRGFENAASAIEGWVRRLAVKTHTPGTPKMGGNNSMAVGMPEFAEGDLIELLDGAGSDDGRGLDGRSRSNERSAFEPNSTGREDFALRARGRMPTSATLNVGGKGKDKGKGKSD